MESLIGMPIVQEGHSAGHLYLADKAAGGTWTDTDEWLVALLARHAAVAIANARLYRTVAEERAAAARARDEAEAGRRQLAVLLQNLPEGVVACDAAGMVTMMNPTGAALMGWELGRPLAERRARVLHADGRPYAEEDLPLIRTLHEDRAFQEEYRVLPPAPDTALRDILTSTAPLHDSHNRLTGAIGVYQDITALKSVERMKDDFFAMATHEFRTPLTSITLASGLLQELLEPAGGPPARLAGLLGDNAQRLRSLVDDLLDLGRLEQGRVHLLPQPLDLRDAAQRATEQIDLLVARKGQHVRMHLPRHDCVVPADPARVEQVLVNLLTNATKYTPAGGNIDITFQRRGHEVMVVVQDDGPGVAADEQDRIFERFYRSRRQDGDGTVGTGLGLPIARMLVELHGGRLWYEDGPRRGSRFCCAWPVGTP